MLYPSINDLLEIMENRYNLVITVSKRARELIQESFEEQLPLEDKPVSMATDEVADGIITFRPAKEESFINEELY